jgi:hypothetical protein
MGTPEDRGKNHGTRYLWKIPYFTYYCSAIITYHDYITGTMIIPILFTY